MKNTQHSMTKVQKRQAKKANRVDRYNRANVINWILYVFELHTWRKETTQAQQAIDCAEYLESAQPGEFNTVCDDLARVINLDSDQFRQHVDYWSREYCRFFVATK